MGMYSAVQMDLTLHPEIDRALLTALLMLTMYDENGDSERILKHVREHNLGADHPFFQTRSWYNLLRDGDQYGYSFAPFRWDLPKLHSPNNGEWVLRVRSYGTFNSETLEQFLDWIKPHLYGVTSLTELAKSWYEETAHEFHYVYRFAAGEITRDPVATSGLRDPQW